MTRNIHYSIGLLNLLLIVLDRFLLQFGGKSLAIPKYTRCHDMYILGLNVLGWKLHGFFINFT